MSAETIDVKSNCLAQRLQTFPASAHLFEKPLFAMKKYINSVATQEAKATSSVTAACQPKYTIPITAQGISAITTSSIIPRVVLFDFT